MPPFNVISSPYVFANCTHIVVSLLKARKMTVVRTDVTMPPFNVISRRSIPEIVLSSKRK